VLAGEKPLPPYKSTKYLSPRTLGKAAGVVRASVAFDYVNNNGQRRLSVQVKDLEELVNFYSLGGPSDKFIQNQISRASKEVEKEQLKTILWERKVVRETLNNILAEYNQKLTGMGSQDLYAKVRDYQSLKPSEKRELMDMFRALYVRSREIANMDQDAINPELIAEVSIGELVPKWVNQINPEKAKDIIASWDKSAPISKKKNIQHRYQSVTEGNGSIKGLEKKAAPRDSNAADRPKDEGKSIQSASGSQTDGPSEQGKNIKFDPNYSAKIAELFKSNLRNFDQHNFKEYLEKGFDPKTHIGPGTVQPFTALTAAAWGGQTKTVKILLEHEADPTVISTGKASNGQLHTLDALGWAKEQGYPEIVKILEEHLAKKAHPEATKNSTTVPVDAAFTAQAVREQFNEKLVKQDQGVLKSYLDKGFDPNAIVYDQFQQKWTAIGLAANHGKYDQVAMLLEYGADPNRPSTYLGNSQGAIGWARKNGHEKVAKLIEDHLAKQAEQMPAVANRTASGNVIIDDAYTEKLIKETDFSEFFKATKDYQAMADILEYGFDPNAVVLRNDQKKVRWTALGLAAFYGNIEVIKALMDYGANPGIKSQYGAGEFAAHEVTRISGRHDVEKFIKEYKPTRPVSAKNPIERGRLRKYDKTYTDQAILDLSGQFMILDSRMDEFLSNGFDPNVTIYENKTNKFSALGMAISRAQVKSVKLLLEAGADPRIKNLVDSKVMDNMTLARQVGNPEIIKMLEEYKAKYSRYLEYPFPEKKLPKIGHTYTLTIISHELKGHHNTLETFDFYTYLEKGFDPNVILWKKDNEQFSALATAIYFSQYDLIKLLLAYGADATVVVNSRAGYAGAMSGLEFAKVHGDPKSIRIIESHLANLKSAQWGSASVKVPVDQAFTEAKSKVVYGGLNGSSNFEIREYLEKGFDPNGIVIRQGNKTWTAICNAAFNGKTEAVRTLLEFGADPTIKSDDFRAGRLSHDALEWAREKGHSKTAQVLEEYYKKHNLPI
jgi:ankyrin repeat protein